MGEPGLPSLAHVVLWCHVILVAAFVHADNHDTADQQPFPREFDYRYISYEDLTSQIDTFNHPDIINFTKLVLDPTNGQLLVGGRNSLFRLSLDALESLQHVKVDAETAQHTSCVLGTPEYKCNNYIRVLLLHNYTQINHNSDVENAVFLCGTNSFKPVCSWRPANDLSTVLETESGIGKSPYDPTHNSTAIITDLGDFYGATNLGPDDRDPAIYRKEGPHTKSKAIRTAQSDSLWLNEPEFVSSYEIGDVVMFFFREVAVEYINCGKKVYSRVARVCKSDAGGVFENVFTTFFKTRLNCSLPGEYPFYFDEIQHTYLLDDGHDKYIYAVFNTPMNSIAGSAVCVYNLTAFNDSFNGPFKYQESPRSAWERYNPPANERPTQCAINQPRDARSHSLQATKMAESKYQLMDSAVQPESIAPIVHADNERWTHIVVDNVLTKYGRVKVMFIATEDGQIRKMATPPKSDKACMIEEIKVVPNGDRRPVKSMVLSSDKKALYVATENTVSKIPIYRCDRFKDREACLNANDPYCGWAVISHECTIAYNGQPELYYWEQTLDGCPVINYPIHGGWSNWTSWATCSQVGDSGNQGDCQCRSRSCDNPKPFNNGKPCLGSSVQVTNCTADGQWTDWTPWSSCSHTCGSMALMRRYRYCSNPPPKFGGRPCIGDSQQDDYCPGNPPCPLPPVKGEWTQWSEWSKCTAQCNGGLQFRTRDCQYPVPSLDAEPCSGIEKEWRMCEKKPCEVLSKETPWTPWVATNRTVGGYFENRYRFMCMAKVPDQNMIQSKHTKTQTRFCIDGGKCLDSDIPLIDNIDGGWTLWTDWSDCSRDCNGGMKWRRRECNNPAPLGHGQDCIGHTREGMQCNIHSCQGQWGCWSPMSVCSVTCGQGVMSRTRRCDTMPPGHRYNVPCMGNSEEFVNCDMGPCNIVALASSSSEGYMEKPRFSLAQLLLVGGLAFFLGGCAAIALYAYVTSFRRAMSDARQNERIQELEKKLKEQQLAQQSSLRRIPKRQSQVSVRMDTSMTSHTSIDNMFSRNKVYDVENIMKDSGYEQGEPYYSTIDKKCSLKNFTIKDL